MLVKERLLIIYLYFFNSRVFYERFLDFRGINLVSEVKLVKFPAKICKMCTYFILY